MRNEDWKKEWKDMPEFTQEDKRPAKQVIVSFETEKDLNDFAALVNQKLTMKTKSIWFPEKKRESLKTQAYISES